MNRLIETNFVSIISEYSGKNIQLSVLDKNYKEFVCILSSESEVSNKILFRNILYYTHVEISSLQALFEFEKKWTHRYLCGQGY
jgi:hypothetical protein